jgi:hypothetical protein
MTDTILVLTEDALAEADVAHLLGLHPDEELAYQVLVPADSDQPLLATVIDELGLGDLRDAFRRARGTEPSPDQARATAQDRLDRTLTAVLAAGRQATGSVTEDDPLPALRAAVGTGDVREVVVITYPHLVEDTLHTDWASRAREELRVPVLHLYSGTSELG